MRRPPGLFLPLPRRYGLFVVALTIAVLIVYQPVWNGGFIWDDAAHVTRPDVRSWAGLWSIWFEPGATQQYYPLTHSFFWLQHRLWGDAPTGYHIVNIVLHAAAASIAGLLLYRLAIPGAYFAAAIFALHPVQVESVAWVTEIKNTLSAVFYLGAAIAWLHYREKASRGAYLLALGLFVLALCTKTVTATLPAALLVIEWWRRGRLSWRRDVLPLVPFFILGIAAGLTTVWVERSLVGAEGAAFDLTLLERGLIAGRALWFYASKLFWPVNLLFIYPRWDVNPAAWWQYVYPAAAIGVLIIAWSVRRRTRGPLAGMLYFAGTLFPALGFFNVYPFLFSFVADHFQYLASLGLITLIAAGMTLIFQRWRLWDRVPAFIVCLGVLSVLGILSWKQSRIYADAESLYRATIERNPEAWMAQNNLAGVLIERGAAQEAAGYAEKALALKPDYAEARNNLGLALASLGRIDDALEQYREALKLEPDYAEAHNNLGFLLARRGDIDEAIAQYRRALAIDPRLAGAHYNLAEALMAHGQMSEAVAELQMALAYRPGYAEAHNSLGVILAQSGKIDEAGSEFLRAVRIRPNYAEARNNLGIVLARSGRLDEAIAHFEKALRDDPASARIRANLRAALASQKAAAEADRGGAGKSPSR
ncbi:MAG: tetratricopeptide repeat protein [Betaproteobacteria bacterium]|nr:MAG: tetratricopeptide repeat protein [Betaproteobacteria bacterium]